MRDWVRARGTRDLPNIADFAPNERAGDLADLSISDVGRKDGKIAYLCRHAGARLEQVHDVKMTSRLLSDTCGPKMCKGIRRVTQRTAKN